MRLDRLDLVRYGKFTDRSLDFGAATPGRPDFHLVYGPNEAGKSTLFSAYLDLLFGIEKSSAYGFLHGYGLMRVGGLLSIGRERHEAYRLKRNQASLVAADDRPLPDGLFSAVLGGMDRNAYRTMFSLDDESIEKGGEDILKSEGELGAMLFSASSGLSDMAAGLAGLKAEAEAFYRPAARKHDLAALKAEIEALAAERKALDVAARDYGLLVRERDAASRQHAEAVTERTRARAALAQSERSLAALPTLWRLRALRAELGESTLGDAPPPAWRGLVGELAREEAELAARRARVDSEHARLCEERAALVADDAVLGAEADIAALAGSALEARFRTAGMDLSAREAERDRLGALIDAGIATLGLPPGMGAADILLPAGLAEKLAERLARYATLAERRRAAGRELAEAERVMEATAGSERDPDAAPEDEEAVQSTLGAVLRAARAGDLPGRLREARRRAALAGQDAEAALLRLAPWAGTAGALVALRVPEAAEIAEARRQVDAAKEADDRHHAQKAALERDVATARATLDALRETTGAAGDGHAADLRTARDTAWHAHLGALDGETAAAFERAMRADDRATAARLENADRLSELRVVERRLAEDAARLAVLRGEAAQLETTKASADAAVSVLARRCTLPEDTTLAEIDLWLERRVAALEALEHRHRLTVEAGLVEEEAEALRSRLAGLIQGATESPIDEFLVLAEDRFEAMKALRAARLAAGDRQARAAADVALRRRAAAAVEAETEAWHIAWDGDIAGTWLSGGPAPTEPERLATLLPALQKLSEHVERHRELEHRIAAMHRDRRDYAGHARRLAERLAEPFDGDDPRATVAAIARRLAAATAVRERAGTVDAALARLAEEADALEERQSVLSSRLSEIFAFLGCDTLAEADILIEAHRRQEEIRNRVAEAARDLAQQMRTQTAEEAEALLAAVDGDQLAAEKAETSARLDALDGTVQEQHLAQARAEEALAGIAGSGAAAALEEQRRTALMGLAERSRRHLVARAGIMAAEQALRLYRERHRSAMMERASRTVRDITGGEYTGLSTVLEKDSEYLVVNAAAGGAKLARDLSKGTRFQLYLALRVAGYHEIAASREVVPFIADDIMETFDDGRTLKALGVMGDMARSGQVIYLTHHQHLRDLARKACPDVTIHEL